ncbi:hypothetical protein [Brucella sp. 2716]|uniref:hypothetical protein n=1 Tax=Brucella sp. 2716 TaxID=2975052 RepID=UPI00217D0172|nr:hypothetical protein [Brucella sp. 2716]UWF59823.1 hypothetical protein NYO66_04745 [Brucella sp. 2716]
MTITAQDLVQREVHYCVSSLVSEMARYADNGPLGEQAYDLAAPVEDWVGAALAGEGAQNEAGEWWYDDGHQPEEECSCYATAQEYCEAIGVEPHYREVYEHWIVSDWLADRLIEKGEKVDKDFAGLTVWARTTTGQAVYCDHVIKQITEEVNK